MEPRAGSSFDAPLKEGLLEKLRSLIPEWQTSMRDAKRLAETQAWVLLAEAGIDKPPVPAQIIECFPEVAVTHRPDMGHSGRVRWNGQRWVIELCTDETPERRRMTLLHELKHVIDDPLDEIIYDTDSKRREKVADYFAAQVLMPKPWLKYDVGGGLRDSAALAERYRVSRSAMEAQLEEIGMSGKRKERR